MGLFKRMYQPGLALSGVGNMIINNVFENGPHSGVLTTAGNDNQYLNNTFDHVCMESGDSGAIYSGRSWIDRGNKVYFNTFQHVHHFGQPLPLQKPNSNGVHLDDQMSGFDIQHNSFLEVETGVRIGGGRDNIVKFNTFTNCTSAVEFDARLVC